MKMWPKEDLLYISPMTSLGIFVLVYTTLLPPLLYVRSSARITLKRSHKVSSWTLFFFFFFLGKRQFRCLTLLEMNLYVDRVWYNRGNLIKATQPCPLCLHIAQENHLYTVKEIKVFRLYSEIHFYLFSDLPKLSMKVSMIADYNRLVWQNCVV